MSHELRTPLNAITGYAEILEEDLTAENRPESAADATRIRRAAGNLLGLINEVLDLSKIEAGRMELSIQVTNVREVVEDVVTTTAHIAHASNNAVQVEIDPSVGELMIDGAKFRQCLLNLVSNACKFTKDGSINIRARKKLSDGPPVLVVVVADTGIGISREQVARLFQPFVQVDGTHTRTAEGTGLGLVITRRLAQLMGGDVTLESEPGKGSRFTLTIAEAVPEEAPIPERRDDSPLVLVIEDESAARDLVRRALARLPLNVLCASSRSEGAQFAREHAPSLIILDIHLQEESGWDLLAEFKAHPLLSRTPIMIVSIDDDRQRAFSLGACEHLVKPVDRNTLAAAVMRFITLPEHPADVSHAVAERKAVAS